MGVRRDRRADVLDREADRSRLERGQLRSPAEHVAVELLVDTDASRLLVDLGVDRVAPSTEVHEVEQRERLLELLARNREPLGELVGVEHRPALVAARREKVGEQRLEHAEALGRNGSGRLPLRRDAPLGPALARVVGGGAAMAVAESAKRRGHVGRAARAGRGARHGRSGGGPTRREARARSTASRRRRR